MLIPSEILSILPKEIEGIIKNEKALVKEGIQEIRLRADKPLFVKTGQGKYFINKGQDSYIVTSRQIKEMVEKISGYSLYAFEEELKQGYITIAGGHRVGFCGRGVVEEGKVKTLRRVSSLNIRIAREIKGCGEKWIPFLLEEGNFCHTLLVSPPGCGKTTLLRDIIRLLSRNAEGRGSFTVGVVDERGEIAAMREGVAQMDVGDCTDVQENCPKAEAMFFLLRSMSPDIIAVDELGKEEDFLAVETLLYAGVSLLCTAHGKSMEDLNGKEQMRKWLEKGVFRRFMFLSGAEGAGTVERIQDGSGKILYERGENRNDTGSGRSLHFNSDNTSGRVFSCQRKV